MIIVITMRLNWPPGRTPKFHYYEFLKCCAPEFHYYIIAEGYRPVCKPPAGGPMRMIIIIIMMLLIKCVYIYIYMYVCLCICIYLYMYVYIYIYIYYSHSIRKMPAPFVIPPGPCFAGSVKTSRSVICMC